MAQCKVRAIQFQGMFQMAVSVHPEFAERDNSFFGEERFIQAKFVAYKYGSWLKLGLICERTKAEDYPSEESKEEEEQKMVVDESAGPRDLTDFNMDTFMKAVKR